MPQTVTLPIFGSSGAQASGTSAQPTNGEWHMDSGGDGMDFDLLAEYLLDDNPGASSGIDFNFADSANASSVVSPEQSVDGAPPDHGAAQAQQIITQHAAAVQHHAHLQPVPGHHHLAPMPAPAPAPLAPAPSHPPVAVQGMSVPSYGQTHIATAQGVQSGIVHQTTTAVAKRRRMDVPVLAAGHGNPPLLADPMAVAAALQGRGRKKTQAQIDRRRERNRILARRTRLRKKFFFESLQKEVVDLQRENSALKDIVRTQLAEDGQKLLEECNATENLPQGVLEACGEHVADFEQQDFNLVRSIQQSRHSFIITDPSLQDNPIVFASDDFLNLTGYAREDVLGRNCRFLQGTDTSQEKVEAIRKGLAMGDDVSVTLVNYTADGTPFWNKLFIAALRDAQSNIVNFIGVIAKVAGPEPSDPEHGKKLPGENELDEDDMLLEEEQLDADGAVKAIEGVVEAAVAAAPSVVHG